MESSMTKRNPILTMELAGLTIADVPKKNAKGKRVAA
jgi:hypothetical protein